MSNQAAAAVESESKLSNADDDNHRCCVAAVTGCCGRLFDWQLLTNSVFLIYGFSAMFIFTGYPPLYIMLPDHARQIGIGK